MQTIYAMRRNYTYIFLLITISMLSCKKENVIKKPQISDIPYSLYDTKLSGDPSRTEIIYSTTFLLKSDFTWTLDLEVIFLMPQLAAEVSSFCISAPEDESGNKNLIVHLELQNGLTKETTAHAKIEKEFFSRLAIVNQDFREALRMTSQRQENRTTVSFYSCMQGPFANRDNRIKTKYIN
jgi:hypothetical protein